MKLPDVHFRPDAVARLRAQPARASVRTARYLPMSDGARIAIDLHLPAALCPGEKLPTILRQTRYFRSVVVRAPFGPLPVTRIPDNYYDTRRFFLSHGYAWIDVDVRGTGASFGHQPYPWSEREVRDGAEIADWIVAQPWSNGAVGSLGISYDGTTAEMLLVNNHPAVRAVAPMFSLFDIFTDVAFPGGLHMAWFTAAWSRFNRTLDANDFPSAIAQAMWLMFLGARANDVRDLRRALLPALRLVREEPFENALAAALRLVFGSVRPVDDDPSGRTLAAAIAEHRASYDIHQGALAITSRDDAGLSPDHPEGTIDLFSPHTHAERLRSSGAAIYGIGGYRDGAYPHAAIKRFRTVSTPTSRLLLGPFCHAGKLYCSASRPARHPAFDIDAELVRFFDLHLRGRDDGLGAEPRVRYYTTGEECWKAASSWPPPGGRVVPFYFADERRLLREMPAAQGHDEYRVDPAIGSGHRSRWRGLLGPLIPADYPDRGPRDEKLLVYTSPPLEVAAEVTGHPVVVLYLRCSAPDAAIFAYLEEVHPDGDVRYVTEGQIRALHRSTAGRAAYDSPAPGRTFLRAHAAPIPAETTVEIMFDLLPISHRFAKGSRIRLALAGADADHFAPPPYPGAELAFFHGGAAASRIDLPIAGCGSG
jgi:putative CocE/NonD family hydrolase